LLEIATDKKKTEFRQCCYWFGG